LLCREAIRLYEKLARGLTGVHLSNRYLDLDPLFGAGKRDSELVCRIDYD